MGLLQFFLEEGMKLVSGEKFVKFNLEGYLNKDLTEYRQERINTRDKNRTTFNWLVYAKDRGEIMLKIKSQKFTW